MPEAGKQQRRIPLTDDGELPDLDHLMNEEIEQTAQPSTNLKPIFCTDCGTTNIPNARYCRNCGAALALQSAPATKTAPPRSSRVARQPTEDAFEYQTQAKRKNDQLLELMSTRPQLAPALLRFFSMMAVGALAINALVSNHRENVWTIIPILIAWFLTESVRNEKKAPHNWLDFWTEAGTIAAITTIGIVALWFQAWVIVPVCIAWFLITSVRSSN